MKKISVLPGRCYPDPDWNGFAWGSVFVWIMLIALSVWLLSPRV